MAQPATYGQWRQKQDRKVARRHLIGLLATAAGTQVLALVLLGHLLWGRLRWLSFADTAVWVVAGTLLLVDIAMVIAPKPVLTALQRGFHAAGHALFSVVAMILVGGVYVLSWPWARWGGRKSFARRHPGSAAWVHPGHGWQRSTWVAKNSEAESPSGSRSTIRRTLAVFHRQRNYAVLLIVLLLLVFATVTMFVKSSAVAPFVYTVF